MKTLSLILILNMLAGMAVANSNIIELVTSKDTFGRSAERNRNSGVAPVLLASPIPGVASIVGFDLSSVTNEIVAAEFSFRIYEDERRPLSFTVATMAHNEKNGKWVEGRGSAGIRGQVAELDEATYQWRAFRDRAWLSADGRTVRNMRDPKLWTELVTKSSVDWAAGTWITINIDDVGFLEAIRTHEEPTTTFGIWGTNGNGVYKINSKESGHPAKLTLQVKPAPEASPSE